MVSGSISLPSPGFFSPFPHGTGSLSVIRIVFSLGEWSPQLPTRFHVPRGTQDAASPHTHSAYRTITPYGRPFHASSAICAKWYSRGPTTPTLELVTRNH